MHQQVKHLIKILLGIISLSSTASDLTFQFGNPSFSGVGQSQHFISIEQLQYTRNQDIKDKQESDAKQAARDEENELINKFVNNVQSRIYAQISKQMVDNMFTDDGDTSGTAELDGATIQWTKDLTTETITIQITEDDGTYTELTVPLTGFGF
jgi:hypothetical protein